MGSLTHVAGSRGRGRDLTSEDIPMRWYLCIVPTLVLVLYFPNFEGLFLVRVIAGATKVRNLRCTVGTLP